MSKLKKHIFISMITRRRKKRKKFLISFITQKVNTFKKLCRWMSKRKHRNSPEFLYPSYFFLEFFAVVFQIVLCFIHPTPVRQHKNLISTNFQLSYFISNILFYSILYSSLFLYFKWEKWMKRHFLRIS